MERMAEVVPGFEGSRFQLVNVVEDLYAELRALVAAQRSGNFLWPNTTAGDFRITPRNLPNSACEMFCNAGCKQVTELESVRMQAE